MEGMARKPSARMLLRVFETIEQADEEFNAIVNCIASVI